MSMSDLLDKIARLDEPPAGQPVVPPPELVAMFVRATRSLRQWKQTTLADFARVSLSTIERLERGEKVSSEALDRVAEALGYERGYFTEPRVRVLPEEAARQIANQYGEMQPVKVKPLKTQRQVRDLANCESFLVYRPDVGSAYDGQIDTLTEWLDLASFILSNPDPREKDRRRELYGSILSCVRELEARGVHVLAGVMDAPQEGLPDWRVAVISLSPRLSDPGAPKRQFIFVDRRCVALPPTRAV